MCPKYLTQTITQALYAAKDIANKDVEKQYGRLAVSSTGSLHYFKLFDMDKPSNSKAPAGWDYFLSNKDGDCGFDKSFLWISNAKAGSFIKNIDVKPGEVYYLEAVVKKTGQGLAYISAEWKDKDNNNFPQWKNLEVNTNYHFLNPDKNGFETIVIKLVVPEDAYHLTIMPTVEGQNSKNCKVEFSIMLSKYTKR